MTSKWLHIILDNMDGFENKNDPTNMI